MPTVNQPHPTLVIGLGGTGSWAVCHVLKDLLDLYGKQDVNELSKVVKLLAIDTASSDHGGANRAPQKIRIGDFELPESVKVPLGDNVYSFVDQIAANRHPHVSAWFDAHWFKSKQNAVNILNLSDGAGAYRPLGRLAVFNNLTQKDVPTLRRAILARSIDEILSIGQPAKLHVILLSSLCGGTGAGMFVDVAYLVKRLSPVPVKTIGYLALPQAFDATVPADETDKYSIRRRAFAAMRELRRFARGVKFASGYPMHYAGSEKLGDLILRGSLNDALFDLLYYFDQSPTSPGRKDAVVPLEEGVAPLMSEAALIWIDGATRNEVREHGANHSEKQDSFVHEKRLKKNAAVAGGVGAFALQLPLHQLIEVWTHELAHDVLRQFLGVPFNGGEDKNSGTAIVMLPHVGGDLETPGGSEDAHKLWRNGSLGGTSLGGAIQDILESGSILHPHPRIPEPTEQLPADRKTELRARQLDEWVRKLDDQYAEDQVAKAIRAKYLKPERKRVSGGILPWAKKEYREPAVKTSDMVGGDAGNNPEIAAANLVKQVDLFLDNHLGPLNARTEVRGGDRNRGEYTKLLDRWASQQVNQFQQAVHMWTLENLNGVKSPLRNDDIERAENGLAHRAGKLAYTCDVLKEMEILLEYIAKELELVARDAADEVTTMRKSNELKTLRVDMTKSSKKQAAFMEKQDVILEAERRYTAIMAYQRIASRMLSDVREISAAADEWKKFLSGDGYSSVWFKEETARKSLRDMERFDAVREIVREQDYEQRRKEHYLQESQAIGAIFNNLRWRLKDPSVSSGTFDIALDLGEQEIQREAGGSDCATILINQCRTYFNNARDIEKGETLLKWLVDLDKERRKRWTVVEVAARLVQRSKPGLRYHNSQPYKVGYVRASSRTTAEDTYINLLMEQVRNSANLEDQMSRIVPSSDPYRLTMLAFDELIDVDNLSAYSEGKAEYLKLAARTDPTGGTSRQSIHVFPAEFNAAIYESRIGAILPDDVAMLLEIPYRFRLIVFAWAYGEGSGPTDDLLNKYRIPSDYHDATLRNKWVWRLSTGPFPDEIDPVSRLPVTEPQHLWLTQPSNEMDPPLIEAATTFVGEGKVFRQNRGTWVNTDYDRVQQWVDAKRQTVIKARGTGKANASVHGQIKLIKDPARRSEKLNLLADTELLQGILTHLEGQISAAEKRLESADQNTASDSADQELDVALYKLMHAFVAEEIPALLNQILTQ